MAERVLSSRYKHRQRRNITATILALAATAVGLGWLVLILGALLWQGFSGLSLAVFTEMTPPLPSWSYRSWCAPPRIC